MHAKVLMPSETMSYASVSSLIAFSKKHCLILSDC